MLKDHIYQFSDKNHYNMVINIAALHLLLRYAFGTVFHSIYGQKTTRFITYVSKHK